MFFRFPLRALLSMSRCALILATLAGTSFGQLVEYDLSIVDAQGGPLSAVSIGSHFRLNVAVTDLRSVPEGLFAAFLNIGFDPTIAAPIDDSIAHSAPYTTITNANLQSGMIANAGGVSNQLAPVGAGTFELFSIEMRALAAGNATFRAMTASPLSSHDETLLYGLDASIPASDQNFIAASMTVVPEPSSSTLILLPLGCLHLCRRWIIDA